MKNKRLLLILSLISLAGTGVAYFFLPERIPIHWNYTGAIDSWGPRWSILLFGALPLVMTILLDKLPSIDPRREAYARHRDSYGIMALVIVLMLIAFTWISVLATQNESIDVGTVVRLIVGLALVGLGNYTGRLKRNYFVGIKTPWALADDEVWRRTHRRGAWVFVLMGLALLVSLFFSQNPRMLAVLVAVPILGIIYIYVYSWMQWRTLHGHATPAKPEEDPRAKP